ncbi:MAG: sigma-70 family RNA polymerase sigma factor [Acidimicrobiia bacterium]
MNDPDRDRDLMARAASGDRAAFTELMDRHEDMVFAVAMRMMRDREAALDATQETFLTLFRKADRYSGEAAVSTWLYRVATNTCLDLLRKHKRRRTEAPPEHHDEPDPSAAEPFSAVEVRPDIDAALRSLPEDFRAAVVLSDIHGLAIAEISQILEVPSGTVKSRVFRGRRMLAEKLGNLHDPSGRQRTDDA